MKKDLDKLFENEIKKENMRMSFIETAYVVVLYKGKKSMTVVLNKKFIDKLSQSNLQAFIQMEVGASSFQLDKAKGMKNVKMMDF